MDPAMKPLSLIGWSSVLLLFWLSPAQAKWPPERKLEQEVKKHWKKQWADQQVEHVTKKTECEKAEVEDAAYQKKTGKSRKLKACLVKADVFVAHGYRYFIYRDTFVYLVKRRLYSVQLGELDKRWKEGGVPAPTQDDAVAMLKTMAAEKLGAAEIQISVKEMGHPRPYGDFYRISLILDLEFVKEGKQEKREKVFATLQSDGTDWKPAPELCF
jgi:hypothetical protein